MAIPETKKPIRRMGYRGNLGGLKYLVQALSGLEDDLEKLDYLTQIVFMSNDMSRILVAAQQECKKGKR